jgi:hypothetical protein
MYPKAGPNRAGRRTRWMLRGQPESNADKAERGYTAGRRLDPAEIASIAASMGLSVSSKGDSHKPRRRKLYRAGMQS